MDETIVITNLNHTDNYQWVREQLAEHDLDTTHVYSGYGIEIYHHKDKNVMLQFLVNWNTDKATLTTIL